MGNVTVELSDGSSYFWAFGSDESLKKINDFIDSVANSGFVIRV